MDVISEILCGNLSSTSRACNSIGNVIFNQKLKPWLALKPRKREKRSLYLSRSVVRNLSPDSTSYNGDNGSTESAKVLLERLFEKTKNLESTSAEDSELSTSLEVLKSEFEVALSTLRKREGGLKDAEKRVLVEEMKLKQTKLELERREREIAASFEKQKQLNVELEAVRLNFANQVRQIHDLQYLLQVKGNKLAVSKSKILEKSAEIEKLKLNLGKKDQVVVKLGSDIKSKEDKIIEFEEHLMDKEAIIIDLKQEIERKEIELSESSKLRELNEERLKSVQRELNKQTSAWLVAQNEFQELMSHYSDGASSINGTVDDFERVRCLLDALRSELASSRELLASSHGKVEFQASQLEKQAGEINRQNKMLLFYSESLESMKLEVDRKNSDLRFEQTKLEQLKLQLTQETEKVKTLEEELAIERQKLEGKSQEVSLLAKDLKTKTQDLETVQSILQIRESELAEAKVQIQTLNSKLSSITTLAERKDKDLVEAKKKLEGVNDEIVQLRKLTVGKEEQLLQITFQLHEKVENIIAIQGELQDVKMRYVEAASVVQQISDLTTNLVTDEEHARIDCTNHDAEEELEIRLDLELGMVKEILRQKELELLEARRQLVIKEEELKSIQGSWKEKETEREIQKKEIPVNETLEVDGLRELYSLVRESVAERNLGDLVTEKLQMELVQLEAEAATIALKKISDLTRNIGDSTGTVEFEGSKLNIKVEEGCFEEAESEIFRLFSLTEQLVREAGISDNER